MSNGEQTVKRGKVELRIETFGRQGDPAILLIHGACASKLYWETGFCEMLASKGRFVIRYDNRDTGLSTSYPPGRPGYALTDMAEDALAILDNLGIQQAEIVGQSMAGAIALVLAIDHPNRVSAVALVATTPGDDDLPPMSAAFEDYTSQTPDYEDPEAIEDHIVGLMRVFCGRPEWFDEARMRAIAREDVARTRNMASALTNHFMIDFDGPRNGTFEDVSVPTLVIHGDQDPVFPLAHAERMRDKIPGACLLVLEDTGHEIPPKYWPVVTTELADLSA